MDQSAVVFEAVVTARDDDNPPLPIEGAGPSGALVTYLTLDPVQAWKGTLASDDVYMRLPGGYHDGNWQVWSHVPRVQVGDRLVLFGVLHGSPALLNAINLHSGLFFLRTGDTVELGSGFTLTDLPVSEAPPLHVPHAWDNDAEDGNCDVNGTDCQFGNAGLDTDLPPMVPMTWSELRSALASCAAAVPQPTVPPATVDHTGVTP